MIKFFLGLLNFSKKQSQIDDLLVYVDGLKQELALYKNGYAVYTTVQPPKDDSSFEIFKSNLSTVAKNQNFQTYLMMLENEVLALFRDGKGEDVYRGALRNIDRIKKDLAQAVIDYDKMMKVKNV